jgi:heavy metal sensor kinase
MKAASKHLRTRLTVMYVLVLTAILMVYISGASVLLFWQLRSQLDRHAIQDLETVEGLLFFDIHGELHLRDDYHNHPESKQVLDRFLEVLSPNGAVLLRNERLQGRSLGAAPFAGEGVGGYSERSFHLADGTSVRLISRRHTLPGGRPTLIRLAYGQEQIWSRVDQLIGISLFLLPLLLATAGFAGYVLARRALFPIEQMARRAEEITPDRLDERLPGEDADDELGHLARVFNKTLARLEQSFEQLRRFTSDASHELRTPLTALRSVGEVGLQKDGSREQYRDVIGSMLEEVNRLTRLVDSLLTISRGDSSHVQFQRSTFSVLDLARESTGLFEVLMEEKGQELILSGDEKVMVQADRIFLRQALVNIVDNAVKYSPSGGTISVRVVANESAGVGVEISDTGPGIAPEHRSRVFDRFYRVDSSRSRECGGAGLGLSIAKWAVQAHGGTIVLTGSEDKPGCTFIIRLPPVQA